MPGVGRRPRKLPRLLREILATCYESPERVLFLDIETTGLSHYYDEITLVGWSLGGSCHTFVKGDERSTLEAAFSQANVMVTFNGIRFDQRFIRKEYPGARLPLYHLDLMYLARRVGLTGGQKVIEQQLGISYREDVGGLDGHAAVLLWHSYLRGDRSALRRLIQYNRADISAMGAIFDLVLKKLGVPEDLFSKSVSFEQWSAPAGWNSVESTIIRRKRAYKRAPSFDSIFESHRAAKARIVGIDLTGSEARRSGWCLLNGKYASTDLLKSNEEILSRTIEAAPDLVSIDSPLCLPAGRITPFDDDPTREQFGIMRVCERELKRRGVNVYPCLLPSMQRLTVRGMEIARALRELGVPVIESYPGAAQDIMRIPRKGAGLEWLRAGLIEFGLRGAFTEVSVSHDELDAITSAIVGTFHLGSRSEELGSSGETPLIVPKIDETQRPVVIGISGPIAAGKTTAAGFLAAKGYSYTRFSQAIDDILAEQGLRSDRRNRQRMGAELNRTGRQRELADRTLARVCSAQAIVVDGLRFPDDHAYFVEKFGLNFMHIFIDAKDAVRAERYGTRSGETGATEEPTFAEASTSEVESRVSELQRLANATVDNTGSREDTSRAICWAIRQHFGANQCLSQ